MLGLNCFCLQTFDCPSDHARCLIRLEGNNDPEVIGRDHTVNSSQDLDEDEWESDIWSSQKKAECKKEQKVSKQNAQAQNCDVALAILPEWDSDNLSQSVPSIIICE